MNCCPSNILSGSALPLPPFPVSKYSMYRHCARLGGELGLLSPVGDHILQEFTTLYLTRFRTYYKISRPPQTKT
jgi:hypothetical protein